MLKHKVWMLVHASTIPDIKDYKKIRPSLGSNSGGVYQHKKTGEKIYVKHSQSNEHAHNEVLASKLYKLAGTPVVDQNFISLGKGKLGTHSKWENLKPMKPNDKKDRSDVQKHIGTHAWLANWDSVGKEFDNQARDENGNMKTIDVGGALNYRAQGELKGKAFGDKPTERKTLKDENINENAAHVFFDTPKSVEKESVERVKAVPESKIVHTVAKWAHPNAVKESTQKLLARQRNL